jgi:hypothetical protein
MRLSTNKLSLGEEERAFGQADRGGDMADGMMADDFTGSRRHRDRQDEAGSPHHTLPRIRTAGQCNEHGGEAGCVSDWCWVLRASAR